MEAQFTWRHNAHAEQEILEKSRVAYWTGLLSLCLYWYSSQFTASMHWKHPPRTRDAGPITLSHHLRLGRLRTLTVPRAPT